MQDVSGLITVDSILNNLPGYESDVRSRVTKRFEDEGFIVDNFSILKQPEPTDKGLADAIHAKIRAKQDAETSKQQLQQSIAEANKQIAKARGDSATKVITAMGEAEAVKKIQQVLSPTYVEYIKATRWNGIQPTVVGSGSGNEGITIYTGSSSTGSICFADGTTTTTTYAGYFNYLHASDAMTFGTGATERMRIDSSGNLGLGVTPSAWGGTYKAEQLGAKAALSYTSLGNGYTLLTHNGYDSGAGAWKYLATGYASQYTQVDGTHQWTNAASGTAGNAITFTQAMTLDASGNLGIGTTSPTARLHAYKTKIGRAHV